MTGQPTHSPRLYTHVLDAIAQLKENGGSHIRTIIDHVQSSYTASTGRPRLRNVALQIRRAIQHGVDTGMLKQTGGRVRLTVGSKNAKGIRTCCGFICGKKKKGGKGAKGVAPKSGRRKGRSKHGKGGGKSKHRSRSGSRGGAGGDPCAPKGKPKRGRSKRKRSPASGGCGKKPKHRRHSSSKKGGSKGGCGAAKAPKPKKKVHRAKKPKECVQQYSDDHNEHDNECSCDTCQPNEEQKNSHVSFADEDEICGDQQQCNMQSPDQIEKRRRSSRSPRRTSRQIRQGTPKNLERLNTEFIPQEDKDVITSNEHVPRSCYRSKEDYGVSSHENTDYINKNFDNNDIHGTSQECDNPDCLCNIKQEPMDGIENQSNKGNPNHCPERFSDRKRSDRDPDRSKDRNRDCNPNRDRNRDGDDRSSYFTN